MGSFPSKNYLTNYLIFGILVEPPTKTISLISVFFNPESSKAYYTGPIVYLKRSALSSSNLALVKISEKSTPSEIFSISIRDSWVEESYLLARSDSLFNFYIALLLLLISTLYLDLRIFMK